MGTIFMLTYKCFLSTRYVIFFNVVLLFVIFFSIALFILNIIFSLDYSGILYYFPQGRTGVPFNSLCDLVALYFAFFVVACIFRVPVSASAVCAGVVEGLGYCWGL